MDKAKTSIDIWREFEKKPLPIQKKVRTDIVKLMKTSGMVRPSDDKVMWEICNRYSTWANEK
jgi:hypothetical protein